MGGSGGLRPQQDVAIRKHSASASAPPRPFPWNVWCSGFACLTVLHPVCREGCQDLQDQVRAVPRDREGASGCCALGVRLANAAVRPIGWVGVGCCAVGSCEGSVPVPRVAVCEHARVRVRRLWFALPWWLCVCLCVREEGGGGAGAVGAAL